MSVEQCILTYTGSHSRLVPPYATAFDISGIAHSLSGVP